MPTRLLAPIARFVACGFLFAVLAAPAAAQEEKPVPSVYGLAPKDALEKLEREGFRDFLLRLDGVETSRAEVEATSAVATWTSPPEWRSAETSSILEIGFQTYVRVIDHVDDHANHAASVARGIGYVLVEGSPAQGTPIADTDNRKVGSFHPSSPSVGAVVAVGAHVGVVLIPPTVPFPDVKDALILGIVIGFVVGAAGAAMYLKSKAAAV